MKTNITQKPGLKSVVGLLCILSALGSVSEIRPYAHHVYDGAWSVSWTSAGEWKQRLTIKGIYHGKNLLVKNPYDSEKGYCVTAIVVNGEVNEGIVSAAEFEIDLSKYGLKPGDEVEIMIEHAKDCVPTVLNPEVLK